MRKLLANTETILFFTFIWVILNEKADLSTCITGAALSLLAILFTNHYLLLDDYKRTYSIGLFQILRYFIFLLYQIYKSGIATIRTVFNKQPAAHIVEYESKLTNDLAICMLANAITLTPGTVTIDKAGSKLFILQFEQEKSETDFKVLHQFEDILERREI